MDTLFYRFRSAAALLGEFQEIEKQEIFFSTPDALNDPMEGFQNIVWTGDRILWRNLLKHYILALLRVTVELMLKGEEFEPHTCSYVARTTDDDLPNAPIRKILADSREEFFQFPPVQAFIKQVADLGLRLRRDGLQTYLKSLHPLALKAIYRAYERRGEQHLLPSFFDVELAPFDDPERLIEMMTAHAQGGENADMALQAIEQMASQLDLLSDARHEPSQGRTHLLFLLRDFPRFFVDVLPKVLFPDWATACFVTDPSNPAMWGVYGDGHRGACLIFRPTTLPDQRPALTLDWSVALRKGAEEPIVVQQRPMLEFMPVRYSDEYPELDFFANLSGLRRSRLIDYWYNGEDGRRSPAVEKILSESEADKTAYWQLHGLVTTSKLPGWQHESEHRLVLTTIFRTHGAHPDTRKLRYRLRDLAGIAFGMKMAHADKLAIIRIIARKAEAEGRHDFAFFQAEHDIRTGRIRLGKMSMLNPNPDAASVAEASAY
jgi:hypothetical protein